MKNRDNSKKSFSTIILPILPLIMWSLISLFITACGTYGEVVKVTTVQEGSLYNGLKKEDLAKLDEIKKGKEDKAIDNSLKTFIEETEHFSVSQYLAKYPEQRGPAGGDYKVGGYDVLSITVYEEKDLSREAVRVSADGYISFPLIGRILVNNLTTSAIERLISYRLAKGQYLLDAHVSAMVTEYNSKRFLVLGAVTSPGSYSLQAQERVLDAISRAGGITMAGDINTTQAGAGKTGMIIRTENPNTIKERKIVINLDLQGLLKGQDQISNIFIADKDVLFIPPAENFFIIGQVQNPGSYTLPQKEVTLVEAISIAGGFTPIAARSKTRIIRIEDGVEKIIEVNVNAITDAGRKIQDVIIKPDDVIIIPESFF